MDGRMRKPNLLSSSLPNVSLSNHHHQGATTAARTLSPLPDTPIIPSPTSKTAANIDDDLWAENVDPSTGSVFYVEASVPSRSAVVPSSSSSSLSSSNPSIPDLLPPPSPLSTQRSTPERFSSSMQLPLDSQVSVDESLPPGVHHAPRALHHHQEKEKKGLSISLQKRVQDMRLKKLGKKHQQLQAASLSDLFHIPHGAQFGSQGTPLNTPTSSPFVGYKIKVELDLTQLHQQAGSGMLDMIPCSLERLGIVPARSLGKGKFGSLLSLQFSFRPQQKQQQQNQQRLQSPTTPGSTPQPVVVKGVRPGCPASGTALKPGDTILTINGDHINMDNVDSVLATLSSCKTLQLLVKKGHAHSPHSYSAATSSSSSVALLSPPQTPSHGGLVRLVAGGRGARGVLSPQRLRKPPRHPHLLLYITLDTNEDDPPEKDILFRYPSHCASQEGGGEGNLEKDGEGGGEGGGRGGGGGGINKELEERLLKLRGVFLTLSDSLATITGSMSHTNFTVMLDGQLFHLTSSQYDKEMLLLALPAHIVSQYQLQLLLESMEQMMTLLHGSAHNALTTSSYSSSLEHLLGLMLDTVLSEDALPPGPSTPLLGVPAIPRLKLPTEVTMKLHAVLSGLEAADHTSRPEILHLERPFLLVGSCLLYRGALACSHLCPSDLKEVTLFLHAYRLLELTASESISQIVIWKEVFLSSVLNSATGKKEEGGLKGEEEEEEEEDVVYHVSQECRVFLLIVGLEQMLLCMLMQEATPTQPDHAHSMHTPSVDAVYIDRGRALLLELRAQDLLSRDFEEISSLPSLQSADSALASLSTHLTRQLLRSSSQHSGSMIASKRKLSDPFGIRFFGVGGSGDRIAVSDSDDDDVLGMGLDSYSPHRTHSMLHLKRPFRQRKTTMQRRAVGSSSGALQQASRTPQQTNSLTSGLENLLLHYICLESGCGLMLCPTHTTPPGNAHSELLRCFQCTCSSVRKVLRGREVGSVLEEEEEDDDDDDDDDEDSEGWESEGEKSTRGSPISSSPFSPRSSFVVEHGVLLESTTARTLKVKSSLQYWVIGRYFAETERELYVCCQESTSQNTIEMAFKLLFGWPG